MSTSAPPLSLILGGCPILFLQFYWLLFVQISLSPLPSRPPSLLPSLPLPPLSLLFFPPSALLSLSLLFLSLSPPPLLPSPFSLLPHLLPLIQPSDPQIVLASPICSSPEAVHSKLLGPGCSFPHLPSFRVD